MKTTLGAIAVTLALLLGGCGVPAGVVEGHAKGKRSYKPYNTEYKIKIKGDWHTVSKSTYNKCSDGEQYPACDN